MTEQARALARRAIGNAGASEAVARSLANATIAAEIHGRPGVGFAHLLDYGWLAPRTHRRQRAAPDHVSRAGRHSRRRLPGHRPAGIRPGFDALLHRAQTFGIAVFAQTNSYTAGELGYYTRRLAQARWRWPRPTARAGRRGSRPRAGLWHQSVFLCGAGRARHAASDRPATSATAYVNLRKAAEHGEPIPEGWAIDAAGRHHRCAALDGLLLAFGGKRGANIALMVEVRRRA